MQITIAKLLKIDRMNHIELSGHLFKLLKKCSQEYLMASDMSFVQSIKDLNIGDKIQVEQYTYSQKYLLDWNFLLYNRIKSGIVTFIGKNFFESQMLIKEGDLIEPIAYDPGLSGFFIIKKIII
jgi:hypothetical protein